MVVSAARVFNTPRGWLCNYCGAEWPDGGAQHEDKCPVGEALAP